MIGFFQSLNVAIFKKWENQEKLEQEQKASTVTEEDLEEKKIKPNQKKTDPEIVAGFKKFGLTTMLEAKKLSNLTQYLTTKKEHSAIEYKYWHVQNKDQRKVCEFFDSANKDKTFKSIGQIGTVFIPIKISKVFYVPMLAKKFD